ncbi:MAG: hypothetical protein HMLKMBBP_02886 [Planctomycetes bacterium]|nr:hypothetical protein [Planctomycetota bacterium]
MSGAGAAGRAGDGGSDPGVLGRAVVQALFAASRLGAMWGFDSKLTVDALSALTTALQAASQSGGDVTLRFAGEQVWCNDVRLRVDFAGFMAYRHVSERATRCGVGEIRMSPSAPRKEFVALLQALESRPEGENDEDRYDQTSSLLRRAAANCVSVGPTVVLEEKQAKAGPQDARQAAAQAWFRAAFHAQRTIEAAASDGKLAPRRLRRAVHELIDVLQRDEPAMLALAQLRNFRGFGPTHLANTAVLACAVALRIGLDRREAADLGVVALLHDAIPPGREPAADEVRRGRADRTARRVLPELGFNDSGMRCVLGVGAHAACGDAAAAPLLVRIVSACCHADTLTTPAGADLPALSVTQALDRLAASAAFDADVVAVLRGILGTYPIGSAVELDTGERAVVCGRNPHFDQPARPVVRILPDDGQLAGDLPAVDLSQWDREQNRFVRSIARTLQHHEVFADPQTFVDSL